MTEQYEFLTPVGGRLVAGSLYQPQTTNVDGKSLIDKKGQAYVKYFIAVAIQKGNEKHWSETEWGSKIWQAGHALNPTSARSPVVAWKVVDGDSTVPNQKGITPAEREAYPGNWVLSFSNGFPTNIYNFSDGTQRIVTEENFVNRGDYIQVFANIRDNGSPRNPGLFLNQSMIAFNAYGERLSYMPDVEDVGFGQGQLPPGASLTPLSGMTTPAAPTSAVSAPPPVMPKPIVVTPHTAILIPPAAPTPPMPIVSASPRMSTKAQGSSYEQLISVGWTDELLKQHGMFA